MEPDYLRLTPAEQEAISNQIIAEETADLTPSEPPSFYLVGAQPGAGKTEIIHLLRSETYKNLLICNADDFRERHPMALRILKEHESDYPDLTWPFANDCNTRLKKYGIANRLNILVETTLQDFDLVIEDFSNMKALGYRTHLLLLAAPPYMSWLGTKLRYETMKAATGYARQVSDEAHDIRFQKLQANLPDFIKCPAIDNVRLFKRKDFIAPGDGSALDNLTNSKSDLVSKYYSVVNEEITLQVKANCYKIAAEIEKLMTRRCAQAEEIEEFKRYLEKRLNILRFSQSHP